MKNNHTFFRNNECEYYPCHKIEDVENFNCMFCFCPLYSLGDKCGGNYCYTEKGIKDCSKCVIPHMTDNYDLIMEKLKKNI